MGVRVPSLAPEKLYEISKKIRCFVELSFCRRVRYCRKMPEVAVPLEGDCRVKMSVLMGDDVCRSVLSVACAMGGGVVC